MPPTPQGGYFLKDGRKVPSVTTILGRFKESGGIIFWAWKRGKDCPNEPLYKERDDAGDTGTYTHALIDAFLTGQPLPAAPAGMADVDAEAAHEAFLSARKWFGQSRLRAESFEKPLVSERFGFGGTPDGLLFSDEENTCAVGDWKSSKGLYAEYLMQVAAYLLLIEENYPDRKIDGGVHIIRFGKTGTNFEHRYWKSGHAGLEIARREFLLLRDAYELDAQLKRHF